MERSHNREPGRGPEYSHGDRHGDALQIPPLSEGSLTNDGRPATLRRVEASTLSVPPRSHAVSRPVSTDEAGPYSLDSLQPRQIVREEYATDDPRARPKVIRQVVDGIIYEKWILPSFTQSAVPKLSSD